jgi:pimeloyl-ACP methyl ester carboxylesterase
VGRRPPRPPPLCRLPLPTEDRNHTMQTGFLPHGPNRIHYLTFGHGPKLLVALHGFGDRARMFAVLAETLGKNYTVVAIDLPFHGQTEWDGRTFCKEDLVGIIRQVLVKEGHERFSLLGFSFGARLAQAMLPDFIDQLDKLYLLSPDGLNTKGMSMAVRTPMPVRNVLYRALQKPQWFLKLVKFGHKTKLVPGLIAHFLASNLPRRDRFQRTFGCWFALNSFYLGRRKITAILNESKLPVDVYFGTRDEMIRFKTLKKMNEELPNMRLFLMDHGHRVVGEALRDAWR